MAKKRVTPYGSSNPVRPVAGATPEDVGSCVSNPPVTPKGGIVPLKPKKKKP